MLNKNLKLIIAIIAIIVISAFTGCIEEPKQITISHRILSKER